MKPSYVSAVVLAAVVYLQEQPPHWYESPEWVLVIVGAATAGVICWQSWETKRAADAAAESMKAVNDQVRILDLQTKATEKTLVLTQRPRIIVRNFYFSELKGTGGILPPTGVQNGSLCHGQFYIANSGGTNARIQEIDCRIWVDAEDGRLPMKRPYEGQMGTQMNKILAPGQSTPWAFSRERPLMHQAMNIGTGKTAIYVLGWIGYTDDLGIYRRTCFCRKYDPSTERFRPVDDPDYENADEGRPN